MGRVSGVYQSIHRWRNRRAIAAQPPGGVRFSISRPVMLRAHKRARNAVEKHGDVGGGYSGPGDLPDTEPIMRAGRRGPEAWLVRKAQQLSPMSRGPDGRLPANLPTVCLPGHYNYPQQAAGLNFRREARDKHATGVPGFHIKYPVRAPAEVHSYRRRGKQLQLIRSPAHRSEQSLGAIEDLSDLPRLLRPACIDHKDLPGEHARCRHEQSRPRPPGPPPHRRIGRSEPSSRTTPFLLVGAAWSIRTSIFLLVTLH